MPRALSIARFSAATASLSASRPVWTSIRCTRRLLGVGRVDRHELHLATAHDAHRLRAARPAAEHVVGHRGAPPARVALHREGDALHLEPRPVHAGALLEAREGEVEGVGVHAGHLADPHDEPPHGAVRGALQVLFGDLYKVSGDPELVHPASGSAPQAASWSIASRATSGSALDTSGEHPSATVSTSPASTARKTSSVGSGIPNCFPSASAVPRLMSWKETARTVGTASSGGSR